MTASSALAAIEFGKAIVADKKFQKPVAGYEARRWGSPPLERLVQEKREARKKRGGSWCYIKKRGRPSKKAKEAREQHQYFDDIDPDEF